MAVLMLGFRANSPESLRVAGRVSALLADNVPLVQDWPWTNSGQLIWLKAWRTLGPGHRPIDRINVVYNKAGESLSSVSLSLLYQPNWVRCSPTLGVPFIESRTTKMTTGNYSRLQTWRPLGPTWSLAEAAPVVLQLTAYVANPSSPTQRTRHT